MNSRKFLQGLAAGVAAGGKFYVEEDAKARAETRKQAWDEKLARMQDELATARGDRAFGQGLAQDAIRNKNAVELATTQKDWQIELAELKNGWDRENKKTEHGYNMEVAQVKVNHAGDIKAADRVTKLTDDHRNAVIKLTTSSDYRESSPEEQTTSLTTLNAAYTAAIEAAGGSVEPNLPSDAVSARLTGGTPTPDAGQTTTPPPASAQATTPPVGAVNVQPPDATDLSRARQLRDVQGLLGQAAFGRDRGATNEQNARVLGEFLPRTN